MVLLSGTDADLIYALVEECTELWDDPPAWQCHLAASIERLVGGFGGVLFLHRPDALVEGGVDIEESAQPVVREWIESGGTKLLPGYESVMQRVRECGSDCRTAASVAGDAAYYHSDFFQRFKRPLRAHHTLFASAECPMDGLLLSMSLGREQREQPFAEREHDVLRHLTELLARRVGRRLTLRSQRGSHRLSPRERQTLSALLRGDSEKQIGASLGLSQLTIHDHVKALYTRFGANSRGELMAYFLRRTPELDSARSVGRVRGKGPVAPSPIQFSEKQRASEQSAERQHVHEDDGAPLRACDVR